MAKLIFQPGNNISEKMPLARYLPRLPEKASLAWLKDNIAVGSWILDPFGASPQLGVEIAKAGYKYLVAINNPIARFLFEMAAHPPTSEEMQAVLAELAATRRADERLEPHILGLYETECDQCKKLISVEAFLWEKEAKHPYARIYTCSHCKNEGEFPVTNSDIEKAEKFSESSPQYFRALQRVLKSDNPDAIFVKNALDVYLPRSVYALFSILNKLDALEINERKRQLLIAMILSACDKGNSLWKEPIVNERPKQLSIPRQFRENNIWMAMEDSIPSWTKDYPELEVSVWPDLPPDQGGICIYEGRFANLSEKLKEIKIEAVVTVYPQPNQAFWTLSTLWSGWLWGRDSIGPFVSVLRNSRYDWAWHTTALVSTLKYLPPVLKPGTLMLGQITDSEPGFDASVLLASDIAGFQLEGQALRPSQKQAQLLWRVGSSGSKKLDKKQIIQEAAHNFLISRGEASLFNYLQAAAIEKLINVSSFQKSNKKPAEIYAEVNSIFQHELTFRTGFLRYREGKDSLKVGHWWLREELSAEEPLADRLEKKLINHLLANPNQSFMKLDQKMCELFPALNTPNPNLIQEILMSYAIEDEMNEWKLKESELPKIRRKDLEEIRNLLKVLGQKLGFEVLDEDRIVWKTDNEKSNYYFYPIASSVIGEIVYSNNHQDQQGIIVLPGSRTELLMYKRNRDPRLDQALEQGWNFLKFRRLRLMVSNKKLTAENFLLNLEEDPIDEVDRQLKLL